MANEHTANFLHFDDGEEKELLVSGWKFGRQTGGYLFRCYVEEENGEKVDKIWTIWDYDSAQALKKKLKGEGPLRIKIKMQKNDEDDSTFEVVG
jgi:hypothetical protein